MKRLLPIVLLLAACSGSQEQSPEPQWHVVDTDFSKGRLGNEQTVTFTDLEKLHGHWCDGLVVGALGLGEALKEFYPTAPTTARTCASSAVHRPASRMWRSA
ncbi:MAG: hypothetical protein IPH05_18530 [Flavobacteriales bacterium]|nr:hypothetical protein [Flavobacteriales bacterium]